MVAERTTKRYKTQKRFDLKGRIFMTNLTQTVVSVLGGKLSMTVNIAGNGPPIFFCHSAGGFYWDDFLENLSQDYTIYAPYFPGTTPGKPDEIEQLDNLWDAVLAYDDAIEVLGLHQPIVMGHSFGGMLAAEIAAQRKSQIDKLVLIAPIGLWKEEASYTVANWCALSFPEIKNVLFHDQNCPRVVKRMARPAEGTEEQALWDRDFIWTIGCTAKLIWPIPDKGLRKRIHRISARSLIVWGENDKLISPSYADDFKRGITGSEIFTIPFCGHEPPLEQTEVLEAAVRKFLSE
jgi:pimeloyl-ACP methyl ester carboxylesterase